MYNTLIHIHHYLSWFVLLAALFAVLRSWYGSIFKKWWSKADIAAGMLFTVSVDLQLVTGIILYAALSPVTTAAFADFSNAVKDPGVRFYAVEHIIIMVLAVIMVHTGSSKARKAQFPARKHRISAIFYSLAALLILSRIPWERIIAA